MTNQILKEVEGFLNANMSIMFAFDESLLVPEFSTEVPTAAVTFSKTEGYKHVKLIFNPDFWATLNQREKEFVFAHEVMHVMFDHGLRGAQYFSTIPKETQDARVLNISMDICSNEILFDQYFYTRAESEFPVLVPMICTLESVFKDKVDQVLPHQNFIYYYEKIFELFADENERSSISIIGLDIPSGGSNGSGEGDEADGDITPEEIAEIQKAINEAFTDTPEDRERGNSSGYSLDNSTAGNMTVKPDEPTRGSLDECLKKVVGTSTKSSPELHKTNWYHQDRRSTAMRSTGRNQMMFPTRRIEKKVFKPSIAIYSDVSGSVANMSKKFFSLIAKLDETKYDIEVFAWASAVSPVDMNKKTGEYSARNTGYGTNIDAVLKYHDELERKDRKYDAVIVLTDGEYSRISNKSSDKYSRWNFFFTGSNYSDNAPKESKKFILE